MYIADVLSIVEDPSDDSDGLKYNNSEHNSEDECYSDDDVQARCDTHFTSNPTEGTNDEKKKWGSL